MIKSERYDNIIV